MLFQQFYARIVLLQYKFVITFKPML